MADPVTMAVIGIGASAAGAAVGGFGAEQSAQAQAQAYQYKAGVAMLNKQINDKNAQFALQEGDIRAEERGLQLGQEVANTKVQQAASGLDVSGASAEGVRSSQLTAGKFDQQAIEWDAEKTAYGYETKSATDVAEANLDTMAAANQKQAGILGMATSFLSGATNVSSKWMQASQAGVFG